VPSTWLQPSAAPDTFGGGSLLSPTLTATPYGSNQGGAAGRVGQKRHSLQVAVKLGPTLTVYGNTNRKGASPTSGDGLRTAVVRNLSPTLRAADGYKGPGESDKREGGPSLTTAVKLSPTLRASEFKGCGPVGSKSQIHRLNRGYLDATVAEAEKGGPIGSLGAEWCEQYMGFPRGWTAVFRRLSKPSSSPGKPRASRSAARATRSGSKPSGTP